MDALNPTSGANGYSPLTPVSGVGAATPSPTPAPTGPQVDSVHISTQGSKMAQHVQQARVVAPLDEATVKKLKEAIAQGKYPAPALVVGLVNLVGNNIAASEE